MQSHWNDFELVCKCYNKFYSENNCVHIHLQKFLPQQANLVHRGNGIYIPQLIAIPGILTTYPRIEKFSWALSQRLKLLLDLPAILGNTWYSLRTFWILNGMYRFHLFSDAPWSSSSMLSINTLCVLLTIQFQFIGMIFHLTLGFAYSSSLRNRGSILWDLWVPHRFMRRFQGTTCRSDVVLCNV